MGAADSSAAAAPAELKQTVEEESSMPGIHGDESSAQASSRNLLHPHQSPCMLSYSGQISSQAFIRWVGVVLCAGFCTDYQERQLCRSREKGLRSTRPLECGESSHHHD